MGGATQMMSYGTQSSAIETQTQFQMAAVAQKYAAENMAKQYNASIMQQSAAVEKARAEKAIQRGEVAAAEVAEQYKRLKGEQRALYSASGVNVNTGTAAQVQASTEMWSVYGQQKERYNAAMEAWGYNWNAKSLEMNAQHELLTQYDPSMELAAIRAAGNAQKQQVKYQAMSSAFSGLGSMLGGLF